MQSVRFIRNPRSNPEDSWTAFLATFDLNRAEALAQQVQTAAPDDWRYGTPDIAFIDGALLLFEGRSITAADLEELSTRKGGYNSVLGKRTRAAHNRWHVLHGKGYMRGGRLMWTGGA
jgi:hypothetical protein